MRHPRMRPVLDNYTGWIARCMRRSFAESYDRVIQRMSL